VLVSDITLPDEDGYRLMRKLRASGSTIPAVAVTARAYAADHIAAIAAGFDAHLAKPAEPAEVVATVATLLGRKPVPPPETV
jgi:DNA-binding response OmpR family regulator